MLKKAAEVYFNPGRHFLGSPVSPSTPDTPPDSRTARLNDGSTMIGLLGVQARYRL